MPSLAMRGFSFASSNPGWVFYTEVQMKKDSREEEHVGGGAPSSLGALFTLLVVLGILCLMVGG